MIREGRSPDLTQMPWADVDCPNYRGSGTCREPQGRTSHQQDPFFAWAYVKQTRYPNPNPSKFR
jgi:hypothetical protein